MIAVMEKNTLRETVYAFNNSNIVASYDADMDIWHPNRVKMASIVCEVLPFNRTEHLRVLDLGAGTGYLSHKIIEMFPRAEIIAVDAAALMIEKAKARLNNRLEHVTFHVSTFQDLPKSMDAHSSVDAVVSSFALHHLYREEKLTLLNYVQSILRPHGWFINCDVLKTADAVLEARFRRLYYQGIQERTREIRHEEKSLDEISSALSDKEKESGDNPLCLMDELQIIAEAGFRTAECFWKEYQEAVYGGIK